MTSLLDTAQRHPLGFFYGIQQISDRNTMRFHLWPEKWRIPVDQVAGQIHDHIFELNSLIITGELFHQTFDFLPDSGGDHEILKVQYNHSQSRLVRSNEFGRLRMKLEETFRPGEVYRVPNGTIHRANPAQAPAATLVLAVTPIKQQSPRVVLGAGEAIPGSFQRAPLNPEEIELLRRTLSIL
jgi:hypothetical protein